MSLIRSRYPSLKNRKSAELLVDEFNGGVNSLFSESRLKKNEAKEATNLMLVEDGVWTKRWGTEQYGGVSWSANILGFSEYKKTDGDRELIVVGDGNAYRVDPSAGTKTAITGASFASGYPVSFLQAKNELYITNGINAVARYDGSNLVTYSSLATPGTVSLSRTSLASGAYTAFYRVTAVNGIGETSPSAEASIAVDRIRDDWPSYGSVSLDWSDVSNALKYVVYYADTTGNEVKLTETTISQYTDDGSAVPNPYIEPPVDNTTNGPKLTSICVSGNRIFGCGDPDNPQRVYFTGAGQQLGNFSPAFGGGWVDLEKGGRASAVAVRDYQGVCHVFCKTDDGKGSIWKVSLEAQTVADTSFIVPIPTKLIASTGTPAERSVVYVENDIFYFNNKGITVLGNEPGVLGVLRTNELSAKIRPYIQDLVEDSLDKISAYYYDAKVFFAVPTATGQPNRIIYFDRERGSWVKDWTVGVSQFGEFTDANGETHFLGASGNKLVEFSKNYRTDQGTAFSWRYTSPRFPVSKNWSDFAYIDKSKIRIREAEGNINFSITGTDRADAFSQLVSKTITASPGFSTTGMGWDKVGSFKVGTTNGTPTVSTSQELIKYFTVRKNVRDFQWTVEGTSAADKATIIGLSVEGTLTESKSDLDWKL